MILQTTFMMTTPKITLATSITTRTMVVDNRYKLAISRLQTRDLFVFVPKDFCHGNFIFVLLDDQLREQVNQYCG